MCGATEPMPTSNRLAMRAGRGRSNDAANSGRHEQRWFGGQSDIGTQGQGSYTPIGLPACTITFSKTFGRNYKHNMCFFVLLNTKWGIVVLSLGFAPGGVII